MIHAEYMLAITYYPADPDSTFLLLAKALSKSNQVGYDAEKANIFYMLSLLHADAGNYSMAIANLDSALLAAERNGQSTSKGRIFNSLGNYYNYGNDTANAGRMYKKAWGIGVLLHDTVLMGVSLGNKAQLAKTPTEKYNLLTEAIDLLSQSRKGDEERAQFLVNLGLEMTDPHLALQYYARAYEIAVKGNTVISRLATLNNMVYSLLETGKVDSAAKCITRHAIPFAEQRGMHDWLATLYDTYADVLMQKGDYKEATVNLRKSKEERSQSDAQQSSQKIRLLATILDTRNKEIALEKKTLELDRQKTIVKIQYLSGFTILLAFTIVIMILIIQGQRRKIAIRNREVVMSRKLVELEEQQTARFGRELHDAVSSIMQRLAGHVKLNTGNIANDPGRTEQHLNELLDSIRSLSHRMNKIDFSKGDLQEMLSELKFDMVNLTGLDLTLNIPGKLPQMSETLSRNIYRIIQEMLTNAGKYARNAKVSVTIASIGKRLVVTYSDNGPGMDLSTIKSNGIGMNGIQERAKLLGGTAQIETSPGKGLAWLISIPLYPGN
jgi:signal transduction histidine kinase